MDSGQKIRNPARVGDSGGVPGLSLNAVKGTISGMAPCAALKVT